MHNDNTLVADEVTTAMQRPRATDDTVGIHGTVIVELRGPDGELKGYCKTHNLVTAVGDQLYASRGAGLTSSALPTGMKLGQGSTAVAKTGAGAGLVTYLSGSNQAFDATYPSVASGVATYKVTYAAGTATTASAITEVVIPTDTIATNATSTVANTISRAILAGIGSKGASDTLTVTWTHTILGA
jgi:hypothetical protein